MNRVTCLLDRMSRHRRRQLGNRTRAPRLDNIIFKYGTFGKWPGQISTMYKARGTRHGGIGIGRAQELLAQEKFKVGAVLPLTGAAADYGIAIKNCVELAKKDRPEIFTNIDFIFEDAAYDPKTAISAYRSLTDGQRVDLTLTFPNF